MNCYRANQIKRNEPSTMHYGKINISSGDSVNDCYKYGMVLVGESFSVTNCGLDRTEGTCLFDNNYLYATKNSQETVAEAKQSR